MSSNIVESDSPSTERTMSEAAPTPPPASPPAKPSRLRRLWKWTKRLLLLIVVLLATTSVVYAIHRQLAFSGGREALAAVRAELDANEPGWRYEEIEAAYNATLPPPGKNSVEVVLKLPVVNTEDSLERMLLNSVIETVSNELPSDSILETAREIEDQLPVKHPAVLELKNSSVGGLPMVGCLFIPDPRWKSLQDLTDRVLPLQAAAFSAQARMDYQASHTYTLAMLNGGRAIGVMPRHLAQGRRNAMTLLAARMTLRMLALGATATGLDELQHEFLVEAERDWMKATFRGERAVLDREAPRMTREDLFRSMMVLRTSDITWEDHLMYRAIEPYREECLAGALREYGHDIATMDRPSAERVERWKKLEDMERSEDRSFPNSLFRFWRMEFTRPARMLQDRDDEVRVLLRGLVVGIACERFRQKNKHWPKSLEEIPKDLLPIPPNDPFNGKSMNYRIDEEGIIIQLNGPPFLNYKHENMLPRTRIKLWNVELRGKKPPTDPNAVPGNDPDDKP